MKTVTITEAKKNLRGILQADEPVQVTLRGQPAGVLRVIAEPKVDRERAREAGRRLVELSERLAAKHRPSKKHGGTQAVRDLRDHGE